MSRTPRLDQVNFRISEQGKAILYALQDYHGLSQAGIFEMLLRQAARDAGWDPKNPPRDLEGRSRKSAAG